MAKPQKKEEAKSLLKFINTYSIDDFKGATNSGTISCCRGSSGKLFFLYNGGRGPIAGAKVPSNPVISLVETPEGEKFYLLHEQGGEVISTL